MLLVGIVAWAKKFPFLIGKVLTSELVIYPDQAGGRFPFLIGKVLTNRESDL